MRVVLVVLFVACFATAAVVPAAGAAALASGAAHAVAGAVHTAAAALGVKALGLGVGAGAAVAGGNAAVAAAPLVASATVGAAATGLTGAAVVAPEAITSSMQASRRPQLRAIGRILQIEIERLKAAASIGDRAPILAARRVHATAVSRAPIISWALDLWFRSSVREEEERALLERRPLEPWQVTVVETYNQTTRGRIPDILTSLRVLQRELTSQVIFGLRTSPLRALRLLYSSLLVTFCALVALCPGFGAVRVGVTKRWPQLVDHLAATLEKNFAATEGAAGRTGGSLGAGGPPDALLNDPPSLLEASLEELKNTVEDATGLDIDGDGYVGKPPPLRRDGLRSRRLEELKNRVESATGLDLDGDGYIGKPPRARRPGLGARHLEELKNTVEDLTGLDIDGDGYVGKPPPPRTPRVGLRQRLARALGRGEVASSRLPPARMLARPEPPLGFS